MGPRKENPTVYSSQTGRICPDCGRPTGQCVCQKKTSPVPKGDGIVRVQRESRGRGGKTVSIITGLDLGEDGLKKLTGELKRLCGAGGAIKEGTIEIQGDHRDILVEALKQQGYRVKKAG